MLASYLIGYDKGSPEIEECIALCRRILRDCSAGDDMGDILRLSAKNLLIMSLIKNDDRKGAFEVAQTMPAFNHVRDINIQMTLVGEERWNYSVSVLPFICVMLGSSFLNKMAHTEENEKSSPLYNYALDECKRDIQLWDALYYEADKRDGGAAKSQVLCIYVPAFYGCAHICGARR